MNTSGPPHYSAYSVEIRTPAGTVVHTESNEYATSALGAASRVLRYTWPQKVGDRTGPRRIVALQGRAEYRVTVKPGPYEVDTDAGDWSVGEVLLADLAAQVATRVESQRKLAEATAALKAAREAYRQAQVFVRVDGSDVEDRANEALAAGVDPTEVAKTRRVPRTRRKTTKGNT